MVTRKLCVVKWGTVRNRCVYIIFAMCNPTVLNLYALHGLVYKFKKNKARGSYRGRKDIGSFYQGPARPQLLLILRSTKDVNDSKYHFQE